MSPLALRYGIWKYLISSITNIILYSLKQNSNKIKITLQLQIYDENYGKLYNYVPESILPAEYGGDMGDVQELTGIRVLKEMNDWINAHFVMLIDRYKAFFISFSVKEFIDRVRL